MSAKLLLRELDRVAGVPGAVEALRASIVELALRGELTAGIRQRAGLQPVAAAEIASGMAALLVERPRYRWKATKVRASSTPGLVPDGWVGASLDDTGLFVNGLPFKPTDWGTEGRPIIRIQNLSGKNPEYNFTRREVATDNLVRDGDLLVSWSATLDTYVWRGEDGVLNQHIFKVISNLAAVTTGFHYWLLKHEVRQLANSQHAHGLAMMHINRGPFLAHRVLLPPLEEQQQIVAKLDELMALCDELEATQANNEARRDLLRTTSLRNLVAPSEAREHAKFFVSHSPRMLTKPEHVVGVRQAILDLAVRGRLSTQDAKDEPASELITSIGTGTTPLFATAVTGGLPEGWLRVEMRRLTTLVTSGSRGWAEYYSSTGPWFIRAQNIRFGHLLLENLAHVTIPKSSEGTRTHVQTGDLLIVITGAGVTNPGLLQTDVGEAYVSQHVGLVRLANKDLGSWVLLCLMAPAGARDELVARAYGSGKPGLNLDNIKTLELPLPPLPEQRRIVAKVNELMVVCDGLELSLANEQSQRARLLEALLHDALEDALGGREIQLLAAR